MAHILTTDNLTKKYGKKYALNGVSLHIEEGRIYGLIGRNGAGKTTIMRIISGLATPTSGSYSLFGLTGGAMRKRLRDVGVLIEQPGIFPALSAGENLKIKCIAMGLDHSGYVDELLATVGLQDVDPRKAAGAFSLGMRQRLGIALALVGDPKILILDEPINGLDPQGIAEVREILVRLRDERGTTIMISSHILDELSKVADAYGIIEEGRLVDELSAEELYMRSGSYVVIKTDDNDGAVRALAGIGISAVETGSDGSLRVREAEDRTSEMAKAIVQSDIGLKEIYLKSISLEDYYLGVTGGEE